MRIIILKKYTSSVSLSQTESSSDLNDFGDMGAAGVTKQMSPSIRAWGQREGMTTSPRLLLTTTSTDNNTFSLYLTLNLRRASAVFQTHIKSSRTSPRCLSNSWGHSMGWGSVPQPPSRSRPSPLPWWTETSSPSPRLGLLPCYKKMDARFGDSNKDLFTDLADGRKILKLLE